jgi:hypothetical protein
MFNRVGAARCTWIKIMDQQRQLDNLIVDPDSLILLRDFPRIAKVSKSALSLRAPVIISSVVPSLSKNGF